MLFAWGAAAADPKRVLLLHSFGRDFKPWSEYARTIRSELERQSPWQLDITEHSLVTARASDEEPEVPFVAYLRALFAKQPPDLIVSFGAPAAAFVQRHRPQLFSNTPMVFTAVDERRVQSSALSRSDAVVPVRIDYLAAIENILQVLPDTENVTVVVGTSPIEQFWMEEIGKAVKPLTNRVSFTWTNHLSFDDVLKHAAALPPRSAIFWELMIVDAAGVVHEGNTALARLHAVSNAPIFSYDESFFGREIVGGPLLAVLDTSRQTAAVAIRILGGESPSDIKVPSIKFSTAEIRLAGTAALGNQRKPPAVGKRGPLSRTERLGALPLADSGHPPRAARAIGDDCMVAGRAIAPAQSRGVLPQSFLGSHASQSRGRSRSVVGIIRARSRPASGSD